jgi:hypothetical protein
MFIVCAIGFIVMHILGFAWWQAIIPGWSGDFFISRR